MILLKRLLRYPCQFRTILKYVGKQRGVYSDEVDHRETAQTCPNCRVEFKKELDLP
ncbi:zinc ribbon domain-containing protein [Coleofasciculus sp. G3-WIS-01]|uniref:zinc ribbon domain-containing protein n=1 Tax=Coleofasciculus sp. G3-WIS-01 TaxID=3069528 RepID=UPI0040631B5E